MLLIFGAYLFLPALDALNSYLLARVSRLTADFLLLCSLMWLYDITVSLTSTLLSLFVMELVMIPLAIDYESRYPVR